MPPSIPFGILFVVLLTRQQAHPGGAVVGDQEDAGGEGDLLADQAIRVTRPVEVLVVVKDGWSGIANAVHPAKYLKGGAGVPFHLMPLK